jgi:DNA-binding winged helix-turn-helix (wHTH) protein/TolB-like protein
VQQFVRQCTPVTSSSRFRFGPFNFDAATLELHRESSLLRLQSQPAQLLARLLDRHGEVISRSDLRQALWGDDTFVDFENGLNFCISQLRSVLHDDPSSPTYIRTIPKNGYQFIAPVERVPTSQDSPAAATVPQSGDALAPPPNSEALRLSPRSLLLALSVGLAASALIFLLIHFLPTPASARAPILAILRFDNETNNPALTTFADSLTDNVVQQLTSQIGTRYPVVGNAQILRTPREQRDLNAIASALHASYIVLGQVQSGPASSGKTNVRVLAHLIRMPDQTHIWVVRLDREYEDPLALESEVARQIASEFSAHLAAASAPPSSPSPPTD